MACQLLDDAGCHVVAERSAHLIALACSMEIKEARGKGVDDRQAQQGICGIEEVAKARESPPRRCKHGGKSRGANDGTEEGTCTVNEDCEQQPCEGREDNLESGGKVWPMQHAAR